ncbi:uncharacterized protein JCM10292_004947 [Rhodotorula paludigena]|uniref:uncharacterized protein n=1 Tax=Rhodotorula paludigena TaxID=86838 RepID=UPI00317C2132
MPHNGIPPEVVDDILALVKDDTRTLLSCCRASRGFDARARPLLYDTLTITYLSSPSGRIPSALLSRSSAVLVDTLLTRPSLARECRALHITSRIKTDADLVRLRTEPTVESIRELCELLPNIEEFVCCAFEDYLVAFNFEVTISRVLGALTCWSTTLRKVALGKIAEEALLFILSKTRLDSLKVGKITTKHPLPASLAAPFSLSSLTCSTLPEDVFLVGTASSHKSLTSLSTCYTLPIERLLAPFVNLTRLTLDFSEYENHDLVACRERIAALRSYLTRDSRLRELTLRQNDGSPRRGRQSLFDGPLPRKLQRFVCAPWYIDARTIVQTVAMCRQPCKVGDGDEGPSWPETLKDLRLTTSSRSRPPLNKEDKEQIQEACLSQGISQVHFVDLAGGTDVEA